MKTIITTLCFLSMGAIGASAQTEVPQIPLLPGWSNLPGDEFEGTEVDKSIWAFTVIVTVTIIMKPLVIIPVRVWPKLIVITWLQ